MTEKSFSLENSEKPSYKDKLLRIVNDYEERIRVIAPNPTLHKETHLERSMDVRTEAKEYEPLRKDVCEAFGVPFDSEHIYMHDDVIAPGQKKQRVLRAFCVVIDAITKDAVYGEGRTGHAIIYGEVIAKLAGITGVELEKDEVLASSGADSRYLAFKGFLSIDEFKDLSPAARSVLETPLLDESGKKIETPPNWFISGTSLEE